MENVYAAYYQVQVHILTCLHVSLSITKSESDNKESIDVESMIESLWNIMELVYRFHNNYDLLPQYDC